jgi:hypothetical protein
MRGLRKELRIWRYNGELRRGLRRGADQQHGHRRPSVLRLRLRHGQLLLVTPHTSARAGFHEIIMILVIEQQSLVGCCSKTLTSTIKLKLHHNLPVKDNNQLEQNL